MPIYEYHCADCRRRVSLLVMRISDPEAPRCPRCGGEQLTRLMSRFAILRLRTPGSSRWPIPASSATSTRAIPAASPGG